MTVARKPRPAKREFTSVVADIARVALGHRDPYWPTEPKEIHYTALKLWQQSLIRWERSYLSLFSPQRWQRLFDCPSSVLWTKDLISLRGQRPRARFCYESWLCPFCYCREIVKFLRPFENRRFFVHTYSRSFTDPHSAWARGGEIGQQLLEQHKGFACWRQVYPCYDRTTAGGGRRVDWVFQGTWLYPGTDSLEANADRLIEALAYPIGTLTNDVSIHEIVEGRDFMRHHQGRMRRGCYRDSTEE